MEKTVSNNYESDFYNLQGASSKPVKGILIYEEAQKKLKITDSGKLYAQKIYNYIPILGPILALIYANFCIGKTKCLRRADEMLFRGVVKYINLFGLLIWPLIFFGIWTLLTYLTIDFSNITTVQCVNLFGSNTIFNLSFGHAGDYNNLWKAALINQLSPIVITDANSFFYYLSVLFGGLFTIFFFPLMHANLFIVGSAQINTNLIFIASIMLLTIINPVNIFNSLLINSSSLRFIIVYEASSIYKYRQKYL